MGLADNYLLQNKDPTDAFFGGIQKYQTMQNNDMANRNNAIDLQQKDDANLRQQQAIQDLQGLDHTDPTALQKYNLLYGDLPVAKNVQAAFAQMQEKEKQNFLGDASKNISLFQNNRPELVVQNARAKAQAYQQAGNAVKAKEYNDFADLAEKSPAAAHQHLLMTYALTTNDKAGGNLKNVVETLAPKVETTDGGDAIYRTSYNSVTGKPITDPIMIAKKGNTPDAVLQANTSIKTTRMNNTSAENVATINGNASNKNAIIAADAGRYSTDQNNATKRLEINQNGQIEWYKAGTGRMNAETERQKATAPKPMTEAQANANLFGTRMQEANKIINDLESKGIHQSLLSRSGTAGEFVAKMFSPEQGQYIQAKEDFINAVLRKESGAAIGKDEFTKAEKQYFPQPGDSPKVVMQKAANRRLAAQLIYQASGQTSPSGGQADHSDLFYNR